MFCVIRYMSRALDDSIAVYEQVSYSYNILLPHLKEDDRIKDFDAQ